MATIESPTTTLLFTATVNGREVTSEQNPAKSLLEFLREDLDLTGAKRGCDIGTCGSCMVIADGKAIYSCTTPLEKVVGARIETIESLSADGNLHPLQVAFVEAHGFQCGICTPGFVMNAKALLDRDPNPSREKIAGELRKNICRCTGYEQLIEAVQKGAGQLDVDRVEEAKVRTVVIPDPELDSLPWKGWDFKVIGTSQPRIESVSRVTGLARYTADLKMAGMLEGALARSPHPHARLLGIDTRAAEACPGVVRVLTAADIPGENRYGKKTRDQRVLVGVGDKARQIADPVAFVVAETREAARAAALLVACEWEVLPAVFEPEEAMEEGAPLVHEEIPRNILWHTPIRKGDVERGFAEADVVIERRFTTQPQDHAPIEPEAAIAHRAPDGKLEVISPGQSVFFDRLNIIRALGLPKDDVRTLQPAIGAAYGKREDIYAQIHVALAAMVTGRPVRTEWTREETMLATAKRTQQRNVLKIGVKKDGTITAFEAKVVGDSGAYASWSPNIMRKAGVLVSGPYAIPNVKVDSYAVYTNNPFTGATRGFGAAETEFATESMMDLAARAIGMDPLAFRRKNVLKKGLATATGHVWEQLCPQDTCFTEVAAEFGWERLAAERAENPKWREAGDGVFRGIGLAGLWYGVGFGGGISDLTDVVLEAHADGTATVFVGTVDYGNGSNTTFAMMAAECLGLPLAAIRVVNADSDRTHNCGSTVATKQTYTTGNAVVRAGLALRKDVVAVAAKLLGIEPRNVDLGWGWAWDKAKVPGWRPAKEVTFDVAHLPNFDQVSCATKCAPDPVRQRRDADSNPHVRAGAAAEPGPSGGVALRDVFAALPANGRPTRREGLFDHAKMTTGLDKSTGFGKAWFPMAFGAQMAEVEVNVKSGRVKVVRIAAAHYVGRAINKRAVRGQIVGGISMGWGFALTEDCRYENGVPQAQNFDQYILQRAPDAPAVQCVIVEHDERTGPFGAIGIGEPPTIGVAPAVANAVHYAIGVRIDSLPITKEKIRAAAAAAGLVG